MTTLADPSPAEVTSPGRSVDRSSIQRELESLAKAAPDDRLVIADRLAVSASAAPEILLGGLENKDWHIRWGAAHALGRAAVVEAAPMLRSLLRDSQPRVARTAAWALGRIRDPEAPAALAAAMKTGNSRLAAAAAWALGHIGTPESIEALAGALDQAEGPLRSLSLAFAEIGPEAAGVLIERLQNGTVAERTHVARILSRFPIEIAPLLIPLLSSTDVRHRRAAAHILGTLRATPGGDRLKPIEESLVQALHDDDGRVRRNAARSVASLGFSGARHHLEQLLAGEPEDSRAAALALGSLGDVDAGPALLEALDRRRPVAPAAADVAAIEKALTRLGLVERPARPLQTPVSVGSTRYEYLAEVPEGLEAVAWEEIAERLSGASLLRLGDGQVAFRWTGSPQAGAILRSVRRLAEGGPQPKEISLARRLRRYRVRTVPASIDPATAYCLARLSDPSDRDVFVDPTCGAGTIAFERSLAGPSRLIVAGDLDHDALLAARENADAGAQRVVLVQWDAARLPLAAGAVSAFAANLPYGLRSGSHQDNRELYPALVSRLARALKPGAIAILLTAEKRLLRESLAEASELQLVSESEVEAGGLHPALFYIQKETDRERTKRTSASEPSES